MTETVKTIFPMNENGRFFEIYGTLCLKRNDESLHITILVSLKSKTDIKEEEKPDSFQKLCRTKSAEWSSRDWYSKANWQRSAIEYGGQSSQDKWKNPKPRVKWKDISHDVEELGNS